jgi:RNA polymerase sigma factor (TIGR02999 family)
VTIINNDIAMLLAAWRSGDKVARDRLFDMLYGELTTIASRLLNRERQGISLCTGDLVNEAIIRLLQSADIDVVDKNHLLALSARVMHHVLLDAARRRNRQKRKGFNVTLIQSGGSPGPLDYDLLDLERAFVRLKAIDPARAEIVEMRYFAGLTIEEIASIQDVSPATVRRRWDAARLWLKEAIENDI